VGDDAADPAGSDDKDFVHDLEKKRKGWEIRSRWQEIVPIGLSVFRLSQPDDSPD
jgi:hypothetical protein